MDVLTKQTIAGFFSLFFVVCLMLFLPAWTIYYWQAWAYLAVFFIPVIAITVYLFKYDKKLLESRVKAGPGAEKEKRQKIIQAFASLFFIGVIMLPAFDHRFHWSNIPISLVLISDLIIVIGFTIVFFVFRENSFTSATIKVDKEQKVVSTGPYRFVRHPMYTGALLAMIFTPIALGSYWGITCAFFLGITIIVRLLDEENYLKKNLDGYEEYCRKVRCHLVPFVW